MKKRLLTLTAALVACSTPAWAVVSLPTHETYSAAADIGSNIFVYGGPAFTPQTNITNVPGTTASIAGSTYTVSASTTQGNNHSYAQASELPSGALGAASFSGWYDQVTISGGTGVGTAQFTVQLNGTVDVGAIAGGMAYTLGTSSIHPSQLTSDLVYFTDLNVQPWPMDAVTPIASYLIGASPYNDTSILFGALPLPPEGGIPAIIDPSQGLGGTLLPTPVYDLLLTPGAGQGVNVTLTGTLNFTYGEAFYLIGGLGTAVLGDGIEAFCSFPFTIGDTCSSPVKDGTGATTLDFSNSANLINIALPQGATASFASGTVYNVTSVPEPQAWLMLLAGLGLVGWATRRHA